MFNEGDSTNTLEKLDTPTITRGMEFVLGEQPMFEELRMGAELTVPSMIENPPQILLSHVYGDPTEEGTDGHYVVKALKEYLQELSALGKKPPVILFAGAHAEINNGEDICQIYAAELQRKLEKHKVAGVSIITEKSTREMDPEYNAGATDTRGEVTFLKYILEKHITPTEKVAVLGRLPHMPRIRQLLKANEVKAETMNVESVLAHFHPDAVEQFISKYQGTVEELNNFRRRDMVFLLFMRMFDRNGSKLESLSKRMGSRVKNAALNTADGK